MPQRTCGVDGCAKPHLARDLCSTHYNQQHQPNRHRKTMVACAWCGRTCHKEPGRANRYAALFCSLACRESQRSALAGTDQCAVPATHPAHPDYRPPLPALWIAPERKPSTRRWAAGACHRCGKPYIAEDYTNTARYCSKACLARVVKDRRRARKRDAYVADVSPTKIFERDRWHCRLCNKKVRRDKAVPHPLAPVLDHVLPLACGGTHEPANVQCAHFLCNSRKGDRADYSEQLALMG